MSTVLILDDEDYILKFLEILVGKHPMVDKVIAVNNAQEAIKATIADSPDIALMDIELNAGDNYNGIQTAKMITSINPDIQLVFITAYDKYALGSYEAHPYDYLIKPINEDKLIKIITTLSARTKIPKNKLAIKTIDGIILLDPGQIFFIEKLGRNAIIHSKQGIFETRHNLKDLESSLPKQFIRTHSAYIINLSRVLMVKPNISHNFQIYFDDYEKTAWVSRRRFIANKQLFENNI